MDYTLQSELYNNIKFNMQKLILDVPGEDALRLGRIFDAKEEEIRKLLDDFEDTIRRQAEEIRGSFDIPQVHESRRIAFIGDSITSDRESFFNIIRKIYEGEERLTWIDAAISGDKSDDARMKLYERTMNHHPDIAHILIGTNDMRENLDEDGESCLSLPEYRRNLEYIVKRLRKEGISVILSTISPVLGEGVGKRFPDDNWVYQGSNIDAVNSIIEETAVKFGAKLNDMREVYGRYRAEEILFQDGLHLNAFGQRLLTEHVLTALGELL